ncbi:pentatricopeptide repeat-containing protein At1g11290, chloroplastic [Olea europaea var. sylvestris]|uniref:pentatricopeptide repeat-containing protein At1g11290, chloroplastic n=1 Tax=Olea europaea var. sylvestris TaxID=158386 RepID=UPI000C1D45E5|nr:pentatricopeptide repeat-containing protein At1g11290, chloroplastic [Olea europaea var. sylvestris]
MSSLILPATAPPPLSAAPPPFLTPRNYIPPHVYKHPAAILLELCTSVKELHQFLPLVIKNGLYGEQLFQTKIVSLFCKFGSLNDARKVFEPIESKTDPMYHTLLKGYVQQDTMINAYKFFCRMKCDSVAPVVYNFTYLLKGCADSFDAKRGKEIHAQLILNGFSSNLFAMTGVVNLYAKCGLINEACKMFDRMPERDLVCWNTVIAGFAQNGMPKKALELIVLMQKEGHMPDMVTVVSVLPASTAIGNLRVGKSIHGYILRRGLESYVNVATALIDMYSKCGLVGTARLIFDIMDMRTVVSWNTMIDGYAQSGNSEEALELFDKMLAEKLKPSNVTVMGALHACADLGDLKRGQYIHELVNELDLNSDVTVTNSLISMYCKCRRVDIGAQLFDKLQRKTLVSWNAMLLGYAQNGRIIEALNLFCKMQQLNMKPDSFTLVSVITAIAELSVLRQAKWSHGLAIRTGLDKNVYLKTALVDMYAKCGAVHTARKLFDMMDERHVTTWNAMIDGYGTHGFAKEAVELFDKMCIGSINPNDVTFLCIISACSHSGLVDKGRRYFTIMKEEYGLEPSMDHYGAIVDLFGRAGRLEEAWNFIQNMPVQPGLNVFGAMLGACKIHKNIDLGEKAADKLFELEPDDGGYHVLLANIYATASMWDKVAKVRTMMEKTGIQKTPGCSLVDLKNEVHTFYSGSTNHPQSKHIYSYLEKLIDRIKAAGYTPDANSIHDVEGDVQERLLNTHSEKLAIVFGLINTSPGTTIHIRKNLRVCGDCHDATKYISLVTKREIIVRDMHRFHHFKNGACSCRDYW